jgi:hypothetical protein
VGKEHEHVLKYKGGNQETKTDEGGVAVEVEGSDYER